MKKNIVFVIESLHLGGAEKSLVTLLQNLDYTKYNVELITFKKEGFFNEFLPNEVNQIVIEFPKLSLIDRLKYALQRKINKRYHDAQLLWPIVLKYLNKVNKTYDYAIAYNQGFATYFVDEYIQSDIKYAWLNIDYQKAGYNINFDFNIYHRFKKIVAVSPEAKEGLLQELSKINKCLEVSIIKDITDKNVVKQQSELFSNINFNPEKINLVTVCRLAKQKGLHLVVKSAKVLVEKNYDINWHIIGEGGERKILEEYIKQEDLQDIVFLKGANPNPYPYMKAADIYVQTSLFEGLGLTVIEASYLNKPIVCTNFPTVYGILNHEETGLICEMNAESIANSIERLIIDEDLKLKLIQNLSLQDNKDKEITLQQINHLFK